MKTPIKKTTAKKPKMQTGGDIKYYKKSNGTKPSKEINENKYQRLSSRYGKNLGKSKFEIVNNPASNYQVSDKTGTTTVNVPANTTTRTTKTQGIGKGKSVEKVKPVMKKGGTCKNTKKK